MAILERTRAARDIIQAVTPDRIVTLGGDCCVNLTRLLN
jgi:hypothetical protein